MANRVSSLRPRGKSSVCISSNGLCVATAKFNVWWNDRMPLYSSVGISPVCHRIYTSHRFGGSYLPISRVEVCQGTPDPSCIYMHVHNKGKSIPRSRFLLLRPYSSTAPTHTETLTTLLPSTPPTPLPTETLFFLVSVYALLSFSSSPFHHGHTTRQGRKKSSVHYPQRRKRNQQIPP